MLKYKSLFLETFFQVRQWHEYMHSFFKRIQQFIISLRFSIITIFIIFLLLTALLLMSLTYLRSTQSIIFIANKLMTQTSEKIINDIDTELLEVETETQFVAKLIENNTLDVKNKNALIPYLFNLSERYPLAQAAFWSDEKGNFIIAEKESDGHMMLRMIIRDQTPPTNTTIIYSGNYNSAILKQTNSTDFSFDPRTRPWYKGAKQTRHSFWTDVYLYQPSNILGITVASPVINPDGIFRGVFAFAIRLDFLSKFISNEKVSQHGIVFIATQSGDILAFPNWNKFQIGTTLKNIHSLNIPWLIDSFKIYKKTLKKQFVFKYDNKTYLANYNYIPHFAAHGWIVGIVAPEEDFIADLKKGLMFDLALGLLILLIGILLVSSIISRVVDPIKKVVMQIDKIKKFDLSSQEKISSRITEVILLSDAVKALRAGLQSFQKYVPSMLVQQLIKTGQAARIGGTKKELAIFFSDIENFTTLAEHMKPNALMKYMCEYFDEMSKIILSERGTIDKYIGDSIMAFWGSPLKVENPCAHAAQAALTCIKRLDDLNKQWRKNGKKPLITRIGLHLGEAIVGNVGSTERLNYTAVGDAINVASRLEGINKIYSTRIIVSETVFQVIQGQFVLRLVDCVAVKGKITSGHIYELLAHDKSELTFDIDQYEETFNQGFIAYQNSQWDMAITAFEKCLQIYPLDSLGHIFIRRCQEFKLHPPSHWDGIWRFTHE